MHNNQPDALNYHAQTRKEGSSTQRKKGNKAAAQRQVPAASAERREVKGQHSHAPLSFAISWFVPDGDDIQKQHGGCSLEAGRR